MRIRAIKPDDFTNYHDPEGWSSLFVGMGACDWKCCIAAGIPIETCQNSELARAPIVEVDATDLLRRYALESGSVVVGGLEPFNDMGSLKELATAYRNFVDYIDSEKTELDKFVVYTGYNPDEVIDSVEEIYNIVKTRLTFIVKFGRFVPGHKPHADKVLGVDLASDNQYARVITKEFIRNVRKDA